MQLGKGVEWCTHICGMLVLVPEGKGLSAEALADFFEVPSAYLAYFIIQHTAAALVTRLAIGLDTNFYWAAGTLALSPIKYYFAPYYTLAVVAIASHLIAALHFRGPKIWHAPALMLGPAVGVVFVLVYGGAFASVDIPQQYLDYYAEYLGAENALTPR